MKESPIFLKSYETLVWLLEHSNVQLPADRILEPAGPVPLPVPALTSKNSISIQAGCMWLAPARGFDPDEVARLIASIDPDGAREFQALIGRLTAPRPPRPRPGRKIRD